MNFYSLYPSKSKDHWIARKFQVQIILSTIILLLTVNIAFAQKVTIAEKKITLKQAFKKIRNQTGYNFIYPNKLMDEALPVDLNFINATVTQVLDQCFVNQPFTYIIENKTVIVKRRSELNRLLDENAPVETKSSIIGFITNKDGEPLNGATIILQRTKNGVTSNKNGIFVIKATRPGDTLLCSYIGYSLTKLLVTKAETYSVVLKEATNPLDEVVVQAYGQTTRRQSTGDIGVLGHAEIEKQPVFNPLMALQGKIAGVVVAPGTNSADGPVRVEIRGRNAISNQIPADPLYIIDGVPLTILDLGGPAKVSDNSSSGNHKSPLSRGFDQLGMSASGGISPLSSINPQDIESISVLKDADATAIYGSRGANGVILITTKRGKPGDNNLTIGYNQGMNFTAGQWDLLNTQQYLNLRREAFTNDGVAPTPAEAPDLFLWDQNRNFNWQKFLYGGHTNKTTINASLSGGSQQTTFMISGSYNVSKALLSVSGGNTRGTFLASVNSRSKDQRFNIGFSASYSAGVNDEVSIGGTATIAPNAPDVFDQAGKPDFAAWATPGGRNLYPFSNLLADYKTNTSFLNSSLNLSYNIVKGLHLRTNFGYNQALSHSWQGYPISALDPNAPPQNRFGRANFGDQYSNNWIIEPQIEYNSVISKGIFNAMFGGTLQDNSTSTNMQQGVGYTSDALLHSISNADPATVKASSSAGQYKYAGVFARIGYNLYDGRYIINLNGRHDGSSRFGPGNEFGNFGSVGAAWTISKEQWAKSILPKFITYVKLRGSYGLTGSDAIGDYQYLPQWAGAGLGSYNGVSPMVPTIQPNVDYHWQVDKKLETALDIAFWDDRINFTVAWYRNRCNNQLIQFPTPMITGFNSVAANSPANVQNSGLEFSWDAALIKGGKFKWNSMFNISFNRNRLLAYPELGSSPYKSLYKIGNSLSTTYLYHYTGVDPLTGQYTYEDHNNDGKIAQDGSVQPGTVDDDRYVAVDLAPKFSGGWLNTFGYKQISISINFDFVKQEGTSSYPLDAGTMRNTTPYVYDNMWHYPGQNALFAKATTSTLASRSNFTASDGIITDASFIRLSTVAVQYSLPTSLAKRLGVHNIAARMNAQHLLVFSKYPGIDPELQSFGGTPPMRTITWGLNCSL